MQKTARLQLVGTGLMHRLARITQSQWNTCHARTVVKTQDSSDLYAYHYTTFAGF